MIVPTLCVGMHPPTLRVDVRTRSIKAVLPRRAWEQSQINQHPKHKIPDLR
jgi:hypothetical protein